MDPKPPQPKRPYIITDICIRRRESLGPVHPRQSGQLQTVAFNQSIQLEHNGRNAHQPSVRNKKNITMPDIIHARGLRRGEKLNQKPDSVHRMTHPEKTDRYGW